jgi:glycosyltransferase involved in cell wall biosynthesis
MRTSTPGLSYIVPAYNEQDSIVDTVERLKAVLPSLGIPWEIIVVNDGSRDETLERLRMVDGIRIVCHPVNTGYGSAIKTGSLFACYDWIGIVDADGSYDIELIPTLVDKLHEGYDMAVAARRNVLDHDGPFKRLFRRSLISVLNLLLARRIEDPNSGLRVFRKQLAFTFMPFLCDTFSFTTSITIFAFGNNGFVAYVPTELSARTGKSKVRHFRDSLRMTQLIIQGITFFNPLKMFVLLVVAMIVGVWLPSELIAACGFGDVANRYLAVGIISALLAALGILTDTVRISGARSSEKRAIGTYGAFEITNARRKEPVS